MLDLDSTLGIARSCVLLPLPSIVLGCDPADCTGLATRDPVSGRLLRAISVRIKRAGYAQADAIAQLEELLGPARWCAVVERPTPRGEGTPPTHAERFWRDAIELVARAHAGALGVRFRKPTILRPMASQWRGPLGIRVRATKPGSVDERRLELKHAACAWVGHRDGLVLDPDPAEAAAISAWGANAARVGVVQLGRRVVEIGWVP